MLWALPDGRPTVSRGTLHGSRRAIEKRPPLLRGQAEESTDDHPDELSIPDVLVDQSEEVRILHVDDNPEYTELTKTFLERDREEFSIVTETNAVEGFQRLRERPFDCIVADYDMPTTDGLEFLELVREEFPDLPFILFTGAGDEALASEAIAAGVTDYVRKYGGTQQYEVLANRIDNAVERYRAQQRFWDALSWYKRLVEQDLAGVFVVQSGEFIYVNGRFADLLDRPQEELLGTRPREIVCETGETLDRLFHEHGNETFRRECTLKRVDGSTVTVEVSGGTVRCGGETACIGFIWQD